MTAWLVAVCQRGGDRSRHGLGKRHGAHASGIVRRAASPEGHVQLMARLHGAPVEIRPLTTVASIDGTALTTRNVLSGKTAELPADLVVVVGERRARAWEHLVPAGPAVQVIGDAVVPRRVHHAVAEGRAAAQQM